MRWAAGGTPEGESMDCACESIEELQIPPLELFRRKAGIVRVLCRVGLAFSLVAHEAGVSGGAAAAQQLREDQPTVARFYSEADSGYLEFDPGDYKFNSDEEYRWPVSARGAVLKMPRYRTPDEAASVLLLMRQLRFCRRLPPDVQRRMAGQAYYMRMEKGRDVLRTGHAGYSFYVIFSGQVSVTTSSDPASEPIMLRKGDAFGEGALLFETTRSATVTTEKLTEFLIVYDEGFFDSGLGDYFTQQYRRIEHFLRSLTLFSALSTSTLALISRHCCLLEHLDGSVIVRDSLKTQFVWFVISGSAQSFSRVAQVDDSGRLDAESQRRRRLNWLASIDAKIPEPAPMRPRTAAVSNRAPFVLPGDLPSGYLVKTGHLTAGKSFGLSSMFDQSRAFTLVSRGCKILALSRQSLLDHVSRSQLESAHLLYESVPSDKRMQQRCELQCDWMLYRRREMRATVHRLQAISDRFDKTHGSSQTTLPPAPPRRSRTQGHQRQPAGEATQATVEDKEAVRGNSSRSASNGCGGRRLGRSLSAKPRIAFKAEAKTE